VRDRAGGYDVTALPALGYGALADRRGRWKVMAALQGASAVFPTSDRARRRGPRLGRNRNVRVIYLGRRLRALRAGAPAASGWS
jgi:hypothetical protein